MARPKADTDEPSARERMTEAYWHQLEDTPFERMTARGVAREAGVNHNTFYRHFDSIEDMAEKLFEDIVPLGAPSRMMAALRVANQENTAGIIPSSFGIDPQAMRRAWLYAGSGSALLVGLLRNRLIRLWLDTIGVAEDALTDAQLADVAIIFGGLVAAMGDGAIAPDPSSMAEVMQRPLGRAMMKTLSEISPLTLP